MNDVEGFVVLEQEVDVPGVVDRRLRRTRDYVDEVSAERDVVHAVTDDLD